MSTRLGDPYAAHMSATASTQAVPTTPQYPPRITAEHVRRLVDRISAGLADPAAPKTVTTYAPFTGTPIAELPQSTPEVVAAAFELARLAQRGWAARPIADRDRRRQFPAIELRNPYKGHALSRHLAQQFARIRERRQHDAFCIARRKHGLLPVA